MVWGLGIGLLAHFVLELPIGLMTYASAGLTTGILLGSTWLGRWYRDARLVLVAVGVLIALALWFTLPAMA
jgi:ABC-type transport system involved in cytochrome c biogenesis permease subunit